MTPMTPVLVAGALAAGLIPAACDVGGGDAGPTRTETRSVARFDRIEVHGRTTVTVRRGDRQRLTVRGGRRLLEDLETDVDGTTLTIDPHGHGDDPLEVTIALPSLRSVDASSAGDIHVVDVASPALELRNGGAGEITGTGRVERLVAAVDGAGTLRLAGLAARRATVRIGGVGDADVNVTAALDATITGLGDIEYSGDPEVRSDVQGAGDVHRAEP